MQTLAQLTRSFAGPGVVTWIGLRPSRKAEMTHVPRVTVTEDGLVGDHGRAGKRAVTLIQAEHIPVLEALTGRSIDPSVLRRNIVVRGLNLQACRSFGLRLGDVELEITSPCAPCSRMEAALGPGGYTAMRGHGGWCAKVVTPGEIAQNVRVIPRLD